MKVEDRRISSNEECSGGSRGLRGSLKQRSDFQELCANSDHYRATEALNLKESGDNCSPSVVRYVLWREQPLV